MTVLYLAWTLIPIAYGIRASMSVDTAVQVLRSNSIGSPQMGR